MKRPMLLVSHKAGAYPSDLPGLIKGRSFMVPLSPTGPPVVTSRVRKRAVSRDANQLRPTRCARRGNGCLANRVKKEDQGGSSLSIVLPDRATIPSTTADRCRPFWADAAVRLVIGGGCLVGRGEASNWAMGLAAHILGRGRHKRHTRGRGVPVSIKVRREKKEGSAERRRTGRRMT